MSKKKVPGFGEADHDAIRNFLIISTGIPNTMRGGDPAYTTLAEFDSAIQLMDGNYLIKVLNKLCNI